MSRENAIKAEVAETSTMRMRRRALIAIILFVVAVPFFLAPVALTGSFLFFASTNGPLVGTYSTYKSLGCLVFGIGDIYAVGDLYLGGRLFLSCYPALVIPI
jgi:hypothetical protein